jgi:hypothetical protein
LWLMYVLTKCEVGGAVEFWFGLNSAIVKTVPSEGHIIRQRTALCACRRRSRWLLC